MQCCKISISAALIATIFESLVEYRLNALCIIIHTFILTDRDFTPLNQPIYHDINEARRFFGSNKIEMVLIIFEGVKLYKAVYNLHLYTLPVLSGVAIRPLGSCQSWKSYEYSFTTFPIKKKSPNMDPDKPASRLQSQQVGSHAAAGINVKPAGFISHSEHLRNKWG